MSHALNQRMGRLAAIGFCSALFLPAATLAEERLPDPTRPPAGLQAAGAASAPAVAEVLVLQSVLRGRAPAAVISGQLVPLGGRVGGLRLAAITEHGVLLTGPQGTTTLPLIPDAHKLTRARTTTGPQETTQQPTQRLSQQSSQKPPQGVEPIQ